MTLDELRQWFSDLDIDGRIELTVIFYGETLYIKGLGRKVEDAHKKFDLESRQSN